MRKFLEDSEHLAKADELREKQAQELKIKLAREQESAARQLAEAAEKQRIEAELHASRETQLRKRGLLAKRIAIAGCFIACIGACVTLWYKWQSDANAVDAKVNFDTSERMRKEAYKNLGRAEQSEKVEREQRNLAETRANEIKERLEESDRRLDLTNLREAQLALDANHMRFVDEFLDSVKQKHRKNCFAWHYLKRQSEGGLFPLIGHTDGVSSVAFSPDGQRIVSGSDDNTARVWDANTGVLISDAKRPETGSSGTISPDQKFLLLRRFNKVLVIPLTVTPEVQAERRARTCPRPDLHSMEAKRLLAFENKTEADQFAAQVQLALEQQALGQQLVDTGKPEAAQSFFDKAHQLWPKPVPMTITPVAEPAVTPPPPPEPTRIL